MTEIIEIIVEQLSIWAPAIVAVLGIVTTVLTAVNKMKTAVSESQSAIETMKNDKTIKELTSQLQKLASENARLNKSVKLLTDKIVKIEGYSDAKEKE